MHILHFTTCDLSQTDFFLFVITRLDLFFWLEAWTILLVNSSNSTHSINCQQKRWWHGRYSYMYLLCNYTTSNHTHPTSILLISLRVKHGSWRTWNILQVHLRWLILIKYNELSSLTSNNMWLVGVHNSSWYISQKSIVEEWKNDTLNRKKKKGN